MFSTQIIAVLGFCFLITQSVDSAGNGNIVTNVLATRHAAYESGACELPAGQYSLHYPVALGDINSLQYLKYTPALCGQVLRIDCGHGELDIIVSNSNLGGGLDLYASTWDRATGNLPPGETKCNVQLTDRNAFSFDGPRCYYAPSSEKNNPYFHLLGVLNTKGRLVSRATLNGMNGAFNGMQPYFAFHGGPIGPDARVVFIFIDGSSFDVALHECVADNNKEMWS